jgi:hypothetical protein
MIELKNVFNFSINKLNKEYKTIYILCNKKDITINKLINEFKKINLPISTDIVSVFNKIVSQKIKETMININDKYNVIISLLDNLINLSPQYLLKSLIINNIRNINLLIIDDIDTYYKFTEGLLINIYNLFNDSLNNKSLSIYKNKYVNNLSLLKKNNNFFINYLNNNLIKNKIQNIIYLTKCIFICKNNKINTLSKLSLEPNIKLIKKNNESYIQYNNSLNKKQPIIIISNINTIYATLTMCSLLKKRINIHGYINKPEKIPKNSKIIYINSFTKISSKENNIIKYGNLVSKTMIKKLLDETIKLSIPIRFIIDNNNINVTIFKLTNECLAIRLLSIL